MRLRQVIINLLSNATKYTQSGGTISIHSELNKGSRFEVTIELPIDYYSEHEVNVKRALLVSEDEVLIKNMQASFREQNVELITAENIFDAGEAITSQSVDVVLLNGLLHEKTLGDTVRMLRDSAKNKILVFCCDYAKSEQEAGTIRENNVDGLIVRPFFFSKFVHLINAKNNGEASSQNDISVLNGRRFLCAEDNKLNSEILTALLEIVGATCVIYPDGEELVKAFADVKPGDYDAILMDIQMPKMNGLKATQAIREGDNHLGKTIQIIAMTANAFSSDVQDCLEAGMNAHVAKPLEISALENIVKAVVLSLDEV